MIKVACIQFLIKDTETKQERIACAERLIDSVADSDLIVLPEIWNIGWAAFDEYQKESETLDGETISRMAEKARKLNSYIIPGSIVEKRGESLYNTAVLIDPKGQVVAKYSKIHLPGWQNAPGFYSQEARLFRRGEEIVTIKTDLGVLGFSICYDLRFPELYRKMAVNHGAEIFIHITAWPIPRQDNLRELRHARANENLCFLISCNCAGIDHGFQYLGHSAIVNPMGISVAGCGFDECIIKGEIDIDEVYRVRNNIPAFNDIFLSV